MKTLALRVELTYDDDLMHGNDIEGRQWFNRLLLTEEFKVLSPEIGDEIGTMKVVRITR